MGKVKNVVIVNDFGSINGGASKIAFQEMYGLKDKGYDVYYFCGVGPVDPNLLNKGIKSVCLSQNDILHSSRVVGAFRGLWNIKARMAFVKLLQNFDTADTVIHIHGWSKSLSASILNVGESLGFQSFITLHDFFLYCPNGGLLNYRRNKICSYSPMSWQCFFCNCDSRSVFQKYWRFLRQIIQNRVLLSCKNISYISISKLSDNLFRLYRPLLVTNLCRIDNPIDAIPVTMQGYDNNIGCKYLFLGRLSEEKGIRLFLKAVTDLGVNAEVWGSGYLLDELKQQYPNVLFRGWVDFEQRKKLIPSIKALVFPSVCYETFGLAVAEMLSLGIPCIVGDKTAAAEMVQDGNNGFLFEIGNLDSLENAILRMEKEYDLLEPLRYFCKEDYSLETHIDKLVKLFETKIK